jgi:hypothetical protein
MLVFLNTCYDKPRKIELTIHVVGKVTKNTDGSPVANVEVQITGGGISKVLRTTNTNEDGQYSITYYGKCNRADPGTILYVRVRRPEGYLTQPPSFYMLECIEETQTFNFQLKPQSPPI